MNPLVYFILCVFVTEVLSKKVQENWLENVSVALLVNIRDGRPWGDLEDPWNRKITIFKYYVTDYDYKYLAACPASSPLEHQFNKDVSLTKQSVFSRLIIWRNRSLTDSDLDICEESYEPAMIYNTLTGEYRIGYELYYFKNETECNFKNGYPALDYHWINVLSINCSKNNKHVKVEKFDKFSDFFKYKNLSVECKNYRPDDEELYSEENQKKYLKDVLAPSSLFEGTPDLACGQPYGCLTPSQILPLWYFGSSSARLASCSHLNVIPVWKSIADGNLRKVDLFVAAIFKKTSVNEVIFGVNGVLEMMLPSGSREMYLSDTNKCHHVGEIPKIIYRIIKFEVLNSKHMAVIVIHNNPSVIPDTDKLCDKNDTLIHTWDKIINDDPKTGLTYICPMTADLEKKLNVDYYGINKLNFAAIPWEDYEYPYRLTSLDVEEKVDSSFERFLKVYIPKK